MCEEFGGGGRGREFGTDLWFDNTFEAPVISIKCEVWSVSKYNDKARDVIEQKKTYTLHTPHYFTHLNQGVKGLVGVLPRINASTCIATSIAL